jgi:hypothetical protein
MNWFDEIGVVPLIAARAILTLIGIGMCNALFLRATQEKAAGPLVQPK